MKNALKLYTNMHVLERDPFPMAGEAVPAVEYTEMHTNLTHSNLNASWTDKQDGTRNANQMRHIP